MKKRKKRVQRAPVLDPVSFLHQPHDKYAKYVLQTREVAIDLVQYALSDSTCAVIDLDSLVLSADSFIDARLKGHFSDICYTGKSIHDEAIQISIIFEHKSEKPNQPILEQLHRYIANVWSADVRQGKRLSLTIPIVLYHGSEEWQKETIESYFGDIPSELVPYLPRFEYELIDFRKITEEEIEAIRFLFLKNIFRAFKYGRDEGYLSLNWYKILIFAPEARQSHIYPGLLQATVIYCSRVSNIFNEKIVDMDRMLSIEDQNIIRPYVVKLYEEGIEKGIEKGIERMLLPFLKRYSDWSDKQLAELFELQEEQIARLRKKLKEGEG